MVSAVGSEFHLQTQPKKKEEEEAAAKMVNQIETPQHQIALILTQYSSISDSISDLGFLINLIAAFTQDIRHQEEAREEDEAEQTHPLLDPYENRQHHQVNFFLSQPQQRCTVNRVKSCLVSYVCYFI